MEASTSIPDWITAIAGCIALVLAIYEFYFRKRPYLKVEIEVQERKGERTKYVFLGKLVNLGDVPGFFWLKKEDIQIKIGDELYYAERDSNGYVFPNEAQPPFFEIGTIYEQGIQKILAGAYIDNTVHIEVTVRYRSYRSIPIVSTVMHNKFHFKYGVNITNGSEGQPKMTVFVIDQKIG